METQTILLIVALVLIVIILVLVILGVVYYMKKRKNAKMQEKDIGEYSFMKDDTLFKKT